jgi:general secretion pathway protein H
MKMKKRLSGFSLIELLIVLTITISILVLAAPRLNGTLDSLQVKKLSREIVASLRATRSQAISKGQDGTWLLDLEKQYFQYGRENTKKYYADDIKLILTTASKEKVSDTVARIRFFPDGSATGGEIKLNQGKFNYSIHIDWLTGRVKIYE